MQILDFALLAVIVTTAYLGPMILLKLGEMQRSFGMMVSTCCAAATISFVARYTGVRQEFFDLLGVVSVGAGFCLIVLPSALKKIGQVASKKRWLTFARNVAGAREVLQPGMGAAVERELLETALAVRNGEEDDVIGFLFQQRAHAGHPVLRRQIDERICLTYLYARRWNGAIGHYETHIQNRPPVGMVSPQLLVELVRAYGEHEDMKGAAKTMELIEKTEFFDRPMLLSLKARARLYFLASTGKTPAVKSLLNDKGALGDMPKASKCFWTGIAEMNSGDKASARRSIESAAEMAKSDQRAKEFALEKLVHLNSEGVTGPKVLESYVADMSNTVSEKVTTDIKNEKKSGRVVKSMGKTKLREVPVTLMMVAANIGVSILMWFKYQSLGDVGGIIAMGANFRPATLAGECWRLLTSIFVHVGLAHLLLNVYGLWILGRLSEKMFSHWRYILIYLVSGVAGAFSSTMYAKGVVSAGASGAVLGVLGGLAAELFLRRKVYAAWGKVVLGNLLFLIGANVVIGFLYPVIDQSAHVGGMAAGMCMGALFALQKRPIKWLNRSVMCMALLALSVFVLSGVFLFKNPHAATLERMGFRDDQLLGKTVSIPSGWKEEAPGQWVDPVTRGGFDVSRLGNGLSIDDWIEDRVAAEKENLGEGAALSVIDEDETFAASWRHRNLKLVLQGMGGTTTLRLLVFGKNTQLGPVVGAFYYPEALWDDISPTFNNVLDALND